MPITTVRLLDGYSHATTNRREIVQQLQGLLNAQGFTLREDGLFGLNTRNAVRKFQEAHGLDADGVVGPRTWAALHDDGRPDDVDAEAPVYPENDPTLLRQQPLVSDLRSIIETGAEQAGVPSSIICGIGSRESHWGLALTPPGPAGTGDFIPRRSRRPWRTSDLPPDGGGFGRGLMQIDFDAHPFARTGHWQDPEANILYGCGVLRENRVLLRRKTSLGGHTLLRAAIAAYNCGTGNVLKALARNRDVDHYTHGRDYAKDVLDRAEWFRRHGW